MKSAGTRIAPSVEASREHLCQSAQPGFRHNRQGAAFVGCSKCPRMSGRVLCTRRRRGSARERSARRGRRASEVLGGRRLRLQPRSYRLEAPPSTPVVLSAETVGFAPTSGRAQMSPSDSRTTTQEMFVMAGRRRSSRERDRADRLSVFACCACSEECAAESARTTGTSCRCGADGRATRVACGARRRTRSADRSSSRRREANRRLRSGQPSCGRQPRIGRRRPRWRPPPVQER